MQTKILQIVDKKVDLEKLEEITSEIIDKVCWEASFSYGDELDLHIGAKIPYKHKFFTGKKKGEWILGSRGTDWLLYSNKEKIVSSEDDPDVMREKVKIIENTKIVNFRTNYPDLSLTVNFSNGCELTIIPNTEEDDKYDDISYWELFTPYDMVLEVGPGKKWSYRSSKE